MSNITLDRNFVLKVGAHLAPALLVLIAFSSVLSNGLVWDDIEAFRNSARYQNTGLIGRVFTEPLVFWNNYYRPVVSSSFAVQNALFGIDARGLHLFSLLTHACNTLLVTLIAGKLVQRLAIPEKFYSSVLVGMFYGLHPVLIEPVAFASSRFDLMVTLFLLLTTLSTLIVRSSLPRFISVFIFFLLAALSKEMALGFALALPLWLLATDTHLPASIREAMRRFREPRNLSVLLAASLAGIVYLWMRSHALGNVLVNSSDSYYWSPAQRLLLLIRSTFEYVSLVVAPFGNITPAHPLKVPMTVSDPRTLMALVLLPIGIFGLLLLFVRKQRRVVMFLVMALLAMFPVLGLVPLPRPDELYFAETYLTAPMVFFALSIIPATEAIYGLKLPAKNSYRFAAFGLTGVWLILSFITVLTTVPLWKDNFTLWSWTQAKHPTLIAPTVNLAAAYTDTGNYKLALQYVDDALQRNRNYSVAWNLKGRLLDRTGDHRSAYNAHIRAVTLLPEDPKYWIDLSINLTALGKLKDAKAVLLDRALPLDPGNWVANAHLGFVLKQLGEHELALVHFRQALPLASVGFQKQRIMEAIREIESGNSKRKQSTSR